MRKWRKTQLQAYIDKYGAIAGHVIFRLLKTNAANAKRRL